MKVRLALAGVGNCASVFVQGLEYYSRDQKEGLWHPSLAGIAPRDVSVVAAFDVDARKVGLDLSEAMFAKPNVARRYVEVQESGFAVSPGISKGDVPPHLSRSKLSKSKRSDVARLLKEQRVDVFVNTISSGCDSSSQEYAYAAAEAGCSFVNCTPSQVTKNRRLSASFARRKLPLVGDDLMSQFGGTVFHKGILGLMVKRGVRVSKSYQLDVGGGSETFNTVDESIRAAKRSLKTNSVAVEVPYQFDTVAGTTDYVDYMGNDRTSYFWLEGKGFMNSGVSVDVYLRTSDGANAGNVLLDVVRATHKARSTGKLGAVNEICAYGFKSPPVPTHFDEAYRKFSAAFIR